MRDVESVTESQYRNQVVQYDPSIILELCNRLSLKLLREKKTIIVGNWPVRIGSFTINKSFHITHHKIALLAMITLQNHRYAHGKTPSNKEFIALVNNVSTIRNPIDDKKPPDPKEAIFGMMVRLAYQQFPFQEGIFNVLPRHLLLYLYSKVGSPSLNLDREAYEHFGLHVIEYMTIGFALYAASLEHSVFQRSFIENTPVESMKKYLVPGKVEKFLARTSADFDTFRSMCMREVESFPDGGTYRFNPLFDRPIIIRKDGRISIPVPMLVPHVITKGLYYDFLDLFSGETSNPFSDWFGYAFEHYGGLLLKHALGKENVFPEPTYGKEHKRGPDWTVIQNHSAIVFEFRSGRLNKKTKIYGDYSDIAALVKRNIIEPLTKFSGKIADMKAGQTGIPCNDNTEFFPCVVTYEPLYSNQLFNDIIKQQFEREGIPEFDFELMSIEDLEWLLSWAKYESPFDFLKTKWANPEWKVMNIRELIGIKIKQKGISDVRNPLLDQVFNKFWQQTLPELSKESDV
ncbi:MAG: hypothetical protein PHY18_05885 [Dehalococcoidales bacterium]|nr:hypothetical protein [Dehalococcoidales bacterium]